MKAVRWGVDAILTDVTNTWLKLRAALDGTWGSLIFYRGNRGIPEKALTSGFR